jgi:hypothetical protein
MLPETELFIRSYCNIVELQNVLVTSFGDENNIIENVIKGVNDNFSKGIEIIYLETSKPKYEQIRNKYAFVPFVNCINMYPVNIKDFNNITISQDLSSNRYINSLISKELRYIEDNEVDNGYLNYISTQNNISLCVLNNSDIITILELKYLINISPAYFIRNNSCFIEDIKKIFETYGYTQLYKDKNYSMFVKPEIYLYFED